MDNGAFNDLEALRIAIGIENRGEEFYRAAASRMKDKETRDMLEELAAQEREHAETFQKIYDGIKENKEEFDDTYLYDPETSGYLRALAESFVFPGRDEQDSVADGINSARDALKWGIYMEKESILFYTEMVEKARYKDAKTAFNRLLREEKQHLVDLQEALNRLF